MILKDAGVSEFICPEYTVRFPPPPPIVEVKQVTAVPLAGTVTGAADAPEADNYTKLFRGKKPRLVEKATE